MKKKKVLMVGNFPLPITGLSYANEELFKSLSRREEFNVNRINLPSELTSKQGSFTAGKAFKYLIIYLGVWKVLVNDFIYITCGQTFFGVVKCTPFILLGYSLRKKIIVHLHGNYLGRMYLSCSDSQKRILRWIFSKVSSGIVLSDSLRSNFENLLDDKKVFVVNNFVDDKFFSTDFSKKDYSTLNLIYLSNLMSEKGILVLLDALEILSQSGIEYKCILAGGIERSIESTVQKQIEQNQRIKYLGVLNLEEKIQAFEDSNIFVLPTFYENEGQPISLLEAIASGCYVITTSQGGIPDIVKGENGAIIQKRSVKGLVDCLLSVNSTKLELEKKSSFNLLYAKKFTCGRFVDSIVNQMTYE